MENVQVLMLCSGQASRKDGEGGGAHGHPKVWLGGLPEEDSAGGRRADPGSPEQQLGEEPLFMLSLIMMTV